MDRNEPLIIQNNVINMEITPSVQQKSKKITKKSKTQSPKINQDLLICSIDVGLVKMAFTVINQNKLIIEAGTISVKPDKEDDKNTKISYKNQLIQMIQNIEDFIQNVCNKHNISIFLIEQQIGKYAQAHIQISIIQSILHQQITQNKQYRIELINPKCKLSVKFKDDGVDNVEEFQPNTQTGKYHQNKNQSVYYCKIFLRKTQQILELTRDIADSILQALYFLDKKLDSQ